MVKIVKVGKAFNPIRILREEFFRWYINFHLSLEFSKGYFPSKFNPVFWYINIGPIEIKRVLP